MFEGVSGFEGEPGQLDPPRRSAVVGSKALRQSKARPGRTAEAPFPPSEHLPACALSRAAYPSNQLAGSRCVLDYTLSSPTGHFQGERFMIDGQANGESAMSCGRAIGSALWWLRVACVWPMGIGPPADTWLAESEGTSSVEPRPSQPTGDSGLFHSVSTCLDILPASYIFNAPIINAPSSILATSPRIYVMDSRRFFDRIDRLQWPPMLKQEYEYCQSLFGQRMVLHDRRVNFKPVIMPLTASFFFLWVCAVSLPEKGPGPALFRLAVLPFLLAGAFDLAVNKTYSLGSPLRDVMFPYWGCLIAFRIIDMALVSLWDEDPAPKWIKPRSVPELAKLHPTKSTAGKGTSKATCESRYLWRPVPHSPLFSFDRALYGLDVIMLNRPGTPWLFPWRLRSLDWSLVALNGQRREQLKFGKPEWPFLLALVQQVFHLMAHNYIRTMDLDGERRETRDLWSIKLPDQILVTLALGAIVALSSSLEEAITFPLLLNSKLLPETALLGNTRRAILSKGLAELWGYRWHHNWRRSFVLGFLLYFLRTLAEL
ncbi:hypothetical protein PtA15_2A26 [Puccinia triticina]|uniref:Wax synthase domain-containing protein n=1 Tax=Puccinia triticina TaxID=208348 RepID=A0ABY7C974_9BASI|nr:uncharacterized protein PtA15_2A26 [Puccinia triticina]WAQ81715.1 hypothetical protein PtA15_2A26 [Puccinia triticina]